MTAENGGKQLVAAPSREGTLFFSSYTSVEVSSGEYRIHTAMMGRLTKGGRDEKEEERPVRNH